MKQRFYGKVECKMTNYDRIKNFSKEELTDYLESVISGNRSAIGIKCGNEKCENWKCTECIINWLEQSY
jgi:hypothetical protein